MTDFIFEVRTQKSFEEMVEAIEAHTQVNGFRVLHTHDVQATLAEKGFIREPLKIIEVCNAKYAYQALNIEATVSLLMPCRINVYIEGEQTLISTLRPSAFVHMFEKPELENFAADLDRALIKIIESTIYSE